MGSRERQRTAETMRATAAELEETEACLHHRAESIPDRTARARLHDVATQVTETATDIARRAGRLTPAGETDRTAAGETDRTAAGETDLATAGQTGRADQLPPGHE
ncbi:hypothetical protein BJY16_003715 [Actinoplanes octamycinicus]|uniref:Uncharacterized protein n=1 Tax=Actinoplanes octamycinicus TaxID=135948 RepID=A0A7W7GXT6_9ACTN|nr:hypothetical protein [Actinoplanes octamycinicus]MBB4740256.1 hypothetical protein [Actinoplanes octamycinicus]